MEFYARYDRNFIENFLGIIHGKIVVVACVTLLLAGCGGNVSILKNGTMEEPSKTESTHDTDTNEKQNIENQETNGDEDSENTQEESFIYVDLGGAVAKPGVYMLAEGSRVFQLIELAGGFCEDAYTKQINQADILRDGEQIYVYTVQEAEKLLAEGTMRELSASAQESVETGKVNLNQATKEELMTLTGIGGTRADAILKYREEHGHFQSVEELMQVDGIKEKTYDKIKDCITVQ